MLYLIKREKGDPKSAEGVKAHWVAPSALPHLLSAWTDDRDKARRLSKAEATMALTEIQSKKPGSGRFTVIEDTPAGKPIGPAFGTTHVAPDAPPAVDVDGLSDIPDDSLEVSSSVAGYATVESQPNGSPFIALAVLVGEDTTDGPNLELTLDEVAAEAVDVIRGFKKAFVERAAAPISGTVLGVTYGVDGAEAFAHTGKSVAEGTLATVPLKDYPTAQEAVVAAVVKTVNAAVIERTANAGGGDQGKAANIPAPAANKPAPVGNTPAPAANKPAPAQGKDAGK